MAKHYMQHESHKGNEILADLDLEIFPVWSHEDRDPEVWMIGDPYGDPTVGIYAWVIEREFSTELEALDFAVAHGDDIQTWLETGEHTGLF